MMTRGKTPTAAPWTDRAQEKILLATDGTSQSDAAVAMAKLLAERKDADVSAVIVVARPRAPWGRVDVEIADEYERSIHADSLASARRQIEELGDVRWHLEAKTGEPASAITGLARAMDAKLVLVGIGEHGAISRLFGSETALQLMRICESPVLAVAPDMRRLPRRIVVGMDFSDASIEAARLAFEIAEENATIVLAHVVPWERKEYVPEEWVRSYEGRITAELSRVTHWLDESAEFRVQQRILYGRPGSRLLAFSDEFGADLLVAGSHSRSPLARLVAGQTIGKLIRGAHCSVLVLPTTAAFHLFGAASSQYEVEEDSAAIAYTRSR